MASTVNHAKKILLVEDLRDFYEPIMRWLQEEKYHVTLASSYHEALLALDSEHFHLAIVDIRLEDEDDANEDGMELLLRIEEKQLCGVMPCIVLTSYPNVKNLLTATQERRVARYIQKTAGYRTGLLQAVRELFEEDIKINFDLIYDVDSDKLIPEVANDINWSMPSKPPLNLLIPQVKDVLGKLFVGAKSLYAAKLKPGLTGAAVLHIHPTWENGLGPSYVAKIGRRDKVAVESKCYEEYVKRYLPAHAVTQVGVAYTRHLGALLYTFAENEQGPLEEFDEFYKHKSPEVIINSLRNLFQNTCRYWYDHHEREYTPLPELYYKVFQLDQKKMIERIQVVLPKFDPSRDTFRLNDIMVDIPNPIDWLDRHHSECILPVYHSITHGDLIGRNIMVGEDGKCWLIDFYRTRDSHILRDFVILETDIKYRLLPKPDIAGFLTLEETLLEQNNVEVDPRHDTRLTDDGQKACQVITALRAIAYNFARGNGYFQGVRKEYLLSLLMATLNVVRLRHVEEERKLQAMVSAALICNKLDELARREPVQLDFGSALRSAISSQPAVGQKRVSHLMVRPATKTTAQQRYLAEHLSYQNLTLFIGSVASSASWPTLDKLARQLLLEIDCDLLPSETPMRLFATYMDKVGNRAHLIRKHIEYYNQSPAPFFFEQASCFKWRAVYTTNQHTYLEDAYQRKSIQHQVIVSPVEWLEVRPAGMPVYKLHGCLCEVHHDDPPTMLPVTEYDYGYPGTKLRLRQFADKLQQDLNEGSPLLMLYASQGELELAHQWQRDLTDNGLIWIAGANFTEEEQDYHRNLGLRVLPDDPSDLLNVFSTWFRDNV